MRGISPVEGAPGFKKSLIRPMPNSLISQARASVRTQYGVLGCGWALKDGKIEIEVTVPFNTEAEIHLPDAEGTQITENGQLVSGDVFTKGSGSWTYKELSKNKLYKSSHILTNSVVPITVKIFCNDIDRIKL